ncbi:MAG: hypothetical protein ACSW8I_00255 [bacterium]
MNIKNCIFVICAVVATAVAGPVAAQQKDSTSSRLIIGGYGEAVYSRHFYSDDVHRYMYPANNKDAASHGRVDLPHAVIMLGYDFGHGWSIGTEIEFEHGGTEVATEMEAEEAGEFEQEVERGGEVALEQFWVQKRFNRHLNIRAGHIVVPVGMTNNNHTPNKFFGVYRPEGENTIMPCTWHETGISLWGKAGSWRYEAQLLPALNAYLFNNSSWIHNGSASPYEFRPANGLACALRVDWSGIPGLRIGLSGYAGNSFNNDIKTDNYAGSSKYRNVKGTVVIGALDFAYSNRLVVVRGNLDYGHLSDAVLISQHNMNQTTMTGNPYPHTAVGRAAWDASIEAGVDILALLKQSNTHPIKHYKLLLFGRYDHYDSFVPSGVMTDIGWCERQVVSAGVNYSPIPQIIIKAEGGVRLLDSQYNDEPFLALGITWTGFFKN